MKQPPEAIVEQAMGTIARRQSRRALARRAGRDQGQREQGQAVSVTVTELLDLVDSQAASGQTTTVTGLARLLDVDQPRASKIAREATAAGLIYRASDKHDGRLSHLLLTSEGQAYLDQVHQHRRAQATQAMNGWSAAERDTFAGLLTRFIAALDEPGEAPADQSR
ncbi:MAG TPA: MarR family transcriptional regulator [Streptosporangiaceae bacterium]|nr:MarR family transcriptional regulator [Streptosporangiaceae bacterium]